MHEISVAILWTSGRSHFPVYYCRRNPIISEQFVQVGHIVRTARLLDKETKRDILCPVALDYSWKNSSWSKRFMEQLMEYNILDFSVWEDNDKFGIIFNKLIDGLELFYK